MTTILELVKHARATGDATPLVEAVPYARFLGMGLDLVGGDVIGRMRFSQHLVGNAFIGALHGGTIGALLESTAIFTLLLRAEPLVLPKIINITVEYLRSGKAVDTFASAELTKIGRRIANVRAFAWQEDRARPIATANAHFLLRAPQQS